MVWILIGASVASSLVAAPTLYTIFGRGLDLSTLGTLWRFGPHQFFFTIFVVPFAACLTGCALWWTVVAAKATAHPAAVDLFAKNWPIAFLWPLALAAFIAGSLYINISWSPDKLRTEYAKEAATSIRAIERERSGPAGLNERKMTRTISEARTDATSLTEKDDPALAAGLSELTPFVRLQILLSGRSQRTLGLVDEAVTSLSGLQVWVVLSLGVIDLMCALAVLLMSPHASAVGAESAVSHARLAVLLATTTLLIYAYVFGVYRTELERVVGPGSTSSQNVLAAVGVAVCFAFLAWSVEHRLSTEPLAALLGVASAIAQVIGLGRWGLFRTLFGWDTNQAIQIVMVLLVIFLGSLAIVAVRPQT